MPELPEVETVRRTLSKKLINQKILDVNVYYDGIIATNLDDFIKNIKNQKINDILRVGKWLIFSLDDYYLLSHLRMEGKYFIKNKNAKIMPHEHVIFNFEDFSLRYHDTRKFGRMYLVTKDKLWTDTPLKDIGVEPFSDKFTHSYLESKIRRNKPIKTLLLDQSIIAGIGNIYADEILFSACINPFTKGVSLTCEDIDNIIKYTKEILSEAILMGGTTIRSYTSSLGVKGNFQTKLNVHCREGEKCHVCSGTIVKCEINTRGTYYCPICQKGNDNGLY